MKIIDSSVSIIEECDPYLLIEKAGRTCYKSEDKITGGSAKNFVQAMIKNNHYAMLEHANLIFYKDKISTLEGIRLSNLIKDNNFIRKTLTVFDSDNCRLIISGNIRAINELKNKNLISSMLNSKYKDLVYCDIDLNKINLYDTFKIVPTLGMVTLNPSSDELKNHFYTTAKFICDRGVSHELVRHRQFSFAQESTRYCNYSKDKFGNALTFIYPSEFNDFSSDNKTSFIYSCANTESLYLKMVNSGCTPQQARAVLTNAVKTEVVVTGNENMWNNFFDLRLYSKTGKPHPDMLLLASKLKSLYDADKETLFN